MSNSKGSIGQAFIAAHLLESGFNVLVPVQDGLPYDLVIERGGVYKRVQCKYRTAENGAVKVPKRNNDYRGVGTVVYCKANVDAFAIYCPDNKQIYFVLIEELDGISKHLCLRIDSPRNNQAKGVRLAVDYLNPERIFSMGSNP
jgi:hypothetical protein